jgi:hypothetical protein
MEELEFYNRTEVWNPAERLLNLTFLEGLPAQDRRIIIYSDEAPSTVEGGVLTSYAGNLATIHVTESVVVVSYAPARPPIFYIWGAIAAAGGSLAYLLYRRRKK